MLSLGKGSCCDSPLLQNRAGLHAYHRHNNYSSNALLWFHRTVPVQRHQPGACSMSCSVTMRVCLLLLSFFKVLFSGFTQPEAIQLATSRVLHVCQAQCQHALTAMVLSAAECPVKFRFALLLNWLIHHVTLTSASLLHVGSSAV